MLVRHCAGGVVFDQDTVFLLKNEKGEWILPKGVIREGRIANEVALSRVRYEGGVTARIISSAGETNYEYFSRSRRSPVYNKIDWFVMEATTSKFAINKTLDFLDGGFYLIEDAVEKITYSQDRTLIQYAYRKYQAYLEDISRELEVPRE